MSKAQAGQEVKETNQQTEGAEGEQLQEGTKVSLTELIEQNGLIDEYNKILQATTDKRVTEAVKKTEAKVKTDLQKQLELEKMSEDEKRQAEALEKEQIINAKLRDATIKELKYNLVDILADKNMDLRFKDLIDVSSLLNIEDEDERKTTLVTQVDAMNTIVSSIVDTQVETLKNEYLKGNSPNVIGKKVGVTEPDEYAKAKKTGDITTMLRLKLQGK